MKPLAYPSHMKVRPMNWLAATCAAKGIVPRKPTSNAQISQNHHSLPESLQLIRIGIVGRGWGGWWSMSVNMYLEDVDITV